ncbi:MAG TPA: zinc-dependent metalloprotease [Arachidicoccus sp.]|nr:zinc-dependent metalloprotease [Arachidicoccus sp.]
MLKKLLLCGCLLGFSALSYAQKRDTLPGIPRDTTRIPKDTTSHVNKDSSQNAVKKEAQKPKKPNPIKPYKEIIPDSAISHTGLFTIHDVDNEWFFEIPDSLFNRDILVVTRFDKVPGGAGVYAGEIVNQQMVRFVKGPDKNVFLQLKLTISMADSTSAIYQAVINSNADPYLASFPIKAYGKNSTVIDVNGFFTGDNPALSFPSSTRKRLSIGGLIPDRSFIKHIHTYPINTEVRTVKTYSSIPPPPGPTPDGRPAKHFDAAGDVGVVTIGFNHSFLLLPKQPMQQRLFDPRVGYFADGYTKFGDDQQRVKDDHFIVRWNLKPRPEDFDDWKNGKLVVPQKQIVYYIDPATPKKWRPYLIAGVNDWAKAFEKAGFKDAIVAKEWPVNDTTMSMEDARYSVIRYFASDIENAYGPNVHDPRSGEIIESHIGWYHNVMKLLHDWYMVQAGPIDKRARKMVFDDELMGDLIRFVSSHEIGHTLGLRHNFGSSSTVPVELLRNKKWVEEHGHTPSIMDYARFNYVAQPGDNITSKGIYPRIGVYDYWAIQWGYAYTGAKTPKEDHKITNKWIIENLSKNPMLWFGTETDPYDPRTQSECLGDDNMLASDYGIKNLKIVLKNLPEWTKEEADTYENLEEMYTQTIGQYGRYMVQVLKNVGGIYATPKTIEQPGNVYEPTPKDIQLRAVKFLNDHLFTTPEWLLDSSILNKISSPASTEILYRMQQSVLESLISPSRLQRIAFCSQRYGQANTFQVETLINTVEDNIFSELTDGQKISLSRRSLQKTYINQLIKDMSPDKSANSVQLQAILGDGYSESDVPSIARGHLIELKGKIAQAVDHVSDTLSKYHLQDLLYRIEKAVDAKS